MSICPQELAWEAHAEWFRTALEDRNRYLYVGRLYVGRLYVGRLNDHPQKIGVCRFDVDPGQALASASINLNPAMRGLNLSPRLLAAGIRLFLAERHVDLAATIKKQNASSIRCFTRCGFILHDEDAGYGYYRLPAHR